MTGAERRARSLPKPHDLPVRLPLGDPRHVVAWHLGDRFVDALENAPKGSRLVLEVPAGSQRPRRSRG